MKQTLNIDGKDWELVGTQACKSPSFFEVMLFFMHENLQLKLTMDMRQMRIVKTITEKV